MHLEDSSESASARATAELGKLRRFAGPAPEFWQRFLQHTAELVQASRAILAIKETKPGTTAAWKKAGEHAGKSHADRSVGAFVQNLVALAEKGEREGAAVQIIERSALPGRETIAVTLRLQLSKPEEVCVAIYLLVEAGEAVGQDAIARLQLVSDIPLSYLQSHAIQQAKADVEKFAESLDLLAQVDAEKHFLAASLAFCNALATRHQCDRVSVGWLQNQYIKLQTISRTERFDRSMSAVKAIEVVMEECLDQDEEIVFPRPEGLNVVTRDHELFSKQQQVTFLCSVPLRVDEKVVGVAAFERNSTAFTPVELQQFRLAADRVSRRFSDLYHADRWFGARLAHAAEQQFAKVLGPEHTWLKVVSVLVCLGLAALFLVPVPFRVEGKFILRSDEVAYLTAPYDGYIREVLVRPGDVLQKGAPLLRLDTNDLELEEVAALADQNRYLREAEKARASKSLAEMRIAEALAEQASARLSVARYRLSQAAIKTPFNGVVTEGDLRERIGAPIKQGESMFKVARTDNLYVEAEVNERDVHEISEKSVGEMAFVSQPKLKFPIHLVRIEPAAFPKANENVFLVRCAFDKSAENWWRPGMSGLVKIEAGKRNLFWILTHRTIDFLRMWLWW